MSCKVLKDLKIDIMVSGDEICGIYLHFACVNKPEMNKGPEVKIMVCWNLAKTGHICLTK